MALAIENLVVHYIPRDHVVKTWPKIEGMLSNALRHSAGEYNMDQLKAMVTMGSQHLLVATDGEQFRGAATICFENYPNDRIAFVTAIGGNMIANKTIWEQFELWCKANGCTKVRGFAFDSVARLWKKKFNVDTVYLVVEKKL